MTLRQRALLSLSCLSAGYVLAVTAAPLHLPPLCVFKLVTGLPCPTCNMTHATCSLARGHWVDAVHYHIAVVPFGLVTSAAGVLFLLELLTNRPCLAPAWRKTRLPLVLLMFVTVFVGWILNLTHVFSV